jgi:hypothetical protein
MKPKRAKKKAPITAKPGQMHVSKNAITIKLSANDKRKAAACLEKSGKITFSVKEHSVTKLPQVLDNGKLID